ncbi:MAG: TetR family transcriptional regulator [Oscillospiraceae bacterium]|nr:TetR family transcriptional regulator [Oscillospiraceae bacterium]
MSNQTKKAIREAFLKLLDERPLSKIKVKDITDACGMNRNSFYYHYNDIPSLIEEIFSDEICRIIAEHPNIRTIEECIITAAEFGSENRQMIRHVYSSTRRDLFEQYMWRMCDQTVSLFVNTVYPDIDTASTEWENLKHMLSCLCYGIFSGWLAEGLRSDIGTYLKGMGEINRTLATALNGKYISCGQSSFGP